MKAIVERKHGEPRVLEISEIDKPAPGVGQVLVRVVAAGLNRADTLQRMGYYPPPPGESSIYGLEVSGIIEAVGSGVAPGRVGQKVMALLASGGYAEYVAVDARHAIVAPRNLELVEAAAFPEVAATVYSNLVMVAGISANPQGNAGRSILIHGGSGGVGAHAIQFCLALGLSVFATAGSAAKCEYMQAMGAKVINYREENFEQVIAEETDGRGVDFILDVVGGAYFEKHLRVLAVGGSLVTIAVQGGNKAEINLALMMQKRLSVYGRTLRAQDAAFKAEAMEGVLRCVVPLIESGAIASNVDRVFGFDDIVAAHEYFDSGKHRGKVLLRMS